MSDNLQVIHNLCLSEMRFDGRIARCLYCEDVDREENARTGVELARLSAELEAAKAREAILSTAINRTIKALSPDDEWIGIRNMLSAALNKPEER